MATKRTLKGEASITSSNGYLRISLPRNLYDGKQKYIGLGLKDTQINRAKALIKLKEIQKDIEYDCFDFSHAKYSDKPLKVAATQAPTIKDWIDGFEDKYFLTKPRNRQTLITFKLHLSSLNRHLANYLDTPLNEKIINDVISKTNAATRPRLDLVKSLSVFCKHYKFKYDFTGLSDGYKPKPRNLPKDENIIRAYSLIQETPYADEHILKRAKSWGWILMVLATYGLRAHELFAIDYEKSFKKQDDYVLVLDAAKTDGLKTGGRRVYPVPIEWVEQFELTNIRNQLLVEFKNPITYFSTAFNERLKKKKKALDCDVLKECLNFRPYDLRHRYAIRGHELAHSVEAMARWMGHSVKMHTETYHEWLGEDTDKIVFRNANLRAQELKRAAEDKPSYEELEAKIKSMEEEISQVMEKIVFKVTPEQKRELGI